MIKPMLSDTALSNLFTMGVAAKQDPRQIIPDEPCIPAEDVRLLRAQLIMEEALETIEALGIAPGIQTDRGVFAITKKTIAWTDLPGKINQDGIIDGCCDTIYVAVGTLLACGVPDLPHLAAINAANNSKFPNGVGITDATGKFQKPPGWHPPDHQVVITQTKSLKSTKGWLGPQGIQDLIQRGIINIDR